MTAMTARSVGSAGNFSSSTMIVSTIATSPSVSAFRRSGFIGPASRACRAASASNEQEAGAVAEPVNDHVHPQIAAPQEEHSQQKPAPARDKQLSGAPIGQVRVGKRGPRDESCKKAAAGQLPKPRNRIAAEQQFL